MMNATISTRRVWIARTIAVAVDVLQLAVIPTFIEGFLSPLDLIVDVATAIVMIALLGWHIAFVPTFIVESLPFADLAPTWTIAVLIVTRKTPLTPGTPVASPTKGGSI
jgi:hypothetical protein